MNTRMAFLLTGIIIVAGVGNVQAANVPTDPERVPIAAVDRFSDKAAHLQLRIAGNGISGPNEPVDFDKGPFITQGFSPTSGKPVRYYNFDVQSVDYIVVGSSIANVTLYN